MNSPIYFNGFIVNRWINCKQPEKIVGMSCIPVYTLHYTSVCCPWSALVVLIANGNLSCHAKQIITVANRGSETIKNNGYRQPFADII